MNDQLSENVGSVPQDSATFGTIPNHSAAFGNLPKLSERKENHTLTVREVVRLFEQAGVLRTERSIVNWCRGDEMRPSRLDAYYDHNERKYFITPESVARVIAEEKAKMNAEVREADSEPREPVPNTSEPVQPPSASENPDVMKKIQALEQELLDLKITNKGKDYFIQQLKDDREHFVKERQELVGQLMTHNHRIGELETKLKQIEAPKARSAGLDTPHAPPPSSGNDPDIRTASSPTPSPITPTRIFEVPIQEIQETPSQEQGQSSS